MGRPAHSGAETLWSAPPGVDGQPGTRADRKRPMTDPQTLSFGTGTAAAPAAATPVERRGLSRKLLGVVNVVCWFYLSVLCFLFVLVFGVKIAAGWTPEVIS